MALKHPYFADFYNETDTRVRVEKIKMEIDENIQLDTTEYLRIIK